MTKIPYIRHMDGQCTCGVVKVGGKPTSSRNWNPECPEHGLESAWWSSPAQAARREVDSQRLRELQARAREAQQNSQES